MNYEKYYQLREIHLEYMDIEEAIEMVIDGILEFKDRPEALEEMKLLHQDLRVRMKDNRKSFVLVLEQFGGDESQLALSKLIEKFS